MKKIKSIFYLNCLIMLLPTLAWTELGVPQAERGDAIFRDMKVWGLGFIGHAGIYDYWGNVLGPSSESGAHIIIDAMGGEPAVRGVHPRTFESFLAGEDYWGSYTTAQQLTAEQRRWMITAARTQLGVDYSATVPKSPDVSFRCDGFVEWVYEQVGAGFYSDEEEQNIVLNPQNLRTRMTRNILASPPVLKLNDRTGEVSPGGTVDLATLSIIVTDDYLGTSSLGSGLRLLQLWHGDPGLGGTLQSSKTEKYDISHTYSKDEFGELPEGHWYVRAYDQAGNYSTTNFRILNEPPYVKKVKITQGDVVNYEAEWVDGEEGVRTLQVNSNVTPIKRKDAAKVEITFSRPMVPENFTIWVNEQVALSASQASFNENRTVATTGLGDGQLQWLASGVLPLKIYDTAQAEPKILNSNPANVGEYDATSGTWEYEKAADGASIDSKHSVVLENLLPQVTFGCSSGNGEYFQWVVPGASAKTVVSPDSTNVTVHYSEGYGTRIRAVDFSRGGTTVVQRTYQPPVLWTQAISLCSSSAQCPAGDYDLNIYTVDGATETVPVAVPAATLGFQPYDNNAWTLSVPAGIRAIRLDKSYFYENAWHPLGVDTEILDNSPTSYTYPQGSVGAWPAVIVDITGAVYGGPGTRISPTSVYVPGISLVRPIPGLETIMSGVTRVFENPNYSVVAGNIVASIDYPRDLIYGPGETIVKEFVMDPAVVCTYHTVGNAHMTLSGFSDYTAAQINNMKLYGRGDTDDTPMTISKDPASHSVSADLGGCDEFTTVLGGEYKLTAPIFEDAVESESVAELYGEPAYKTMANSTFGLESVEPNEEFPPKMLAKGYLPIADFVKGSETKQTYSPYAVMSGAYDPAVLAAGEISPLNVQLCGFDASNGKVVKYSQAMLDEDNHRLASRIGESSEYYVMCVSTTPVIPDTAPPQTSITLPETVVDGGYTNLDFLDLILVGDDLNGVQYSPDSGIAQIYWKLNPSLALVEQGLSAETAASFNTGNPHLTFDEGISYLYYGAADQAGNYSPLKRQTFYVDKTAPVVSMPTVSGGVSSGNVLYASPASRMSLTASDPVSHGVSSGVKGLRYFVNISAQNCAGVEVNDNPAEPPGSCANSYSTSPDFQLSGGLQTVSYYALDKVSNAGSMQTVTIAVDDGAPQTHIESSGMEMGTSIRLEPGNQITLSALDPPATDNVSSGVKQIIRLIDTDPSSCDFSLPSYSTNTVGGCGNYEYSGEFSVSQGSHTVTYFSRDNVGNMEAAKQQYVYMLGDGQQDTQPPRTSLSVEPGYNNGERQYAGPGSTIGIAFVDDYVTVGDGLGRGLANSFLLLDGVSVSTLGISGLSAGEHVFEYSGIDLAGNIESTHTAHVFIDSVAPAVTPELTLDGGYYFGDGQVAVSPHTLFGFSAIADQSGEYSSGPGGMGYSIDGGATWTVSTSSFSLAVSSDTALTVNYRAEDKVRNGGPVLSRNVLVDATAPQVTAYIGNTDISASSDVYCTDYDVLHFDYSDPLVLGQQLGTVHLVYALEGTGQTDYYPSRAKPLPVGNYEVSYTAWDAVGNETSRTFNAHVSAHEGEDTEAPITDIAFMSSYDSGNGVYVKGQPEAFQFNAFDTQSGLFTVVYKVDPSEELMTLGFSSSTVDQFDWYWSGGVGIDSDGPHTVVYGAADYAGNYSALNSTMVYVDNTPPNLPWIAGEAYNLDSWNDWWAQDWFMNNGGDRAVIMRPNSQLYFQFSDQEVNGVASGPKAAYATFNGENWPWPQMPMDMSGPGYQVGGEERIGALMYASEDNVGNMSSGWMKYIVDATAPGSEFTVNGSTVDLSSGTIYVGDYDDLGFNMWDPQVGDFPSQARVMYSIDGGDSQEFYGTYSLVPGTYTVTWNALDLAGNAEAEHSVTVVAAHLYDDVTAPGTTVGTYGMGYTDVVRRWFSISPWRLNADDSESGIAGVFYKFDPDAALMAGGLSGDTTSQFSFYTSETFEAFEGSRTIAYGALDNAGNYEVLKSTTIYFDGTAPVLGIAVNGSTRTLVGGMPVFTTDSIELVWGDAGVGLAEGTRYVIDRESSECAEGWPGEQNHNAAPGTCTNPNYMGAFHLPAGHHTVWTQASDKLENGNELRFDFSVSDSTAPSVVPSTGPIGSVFTLAGTGFGAYNGSNTRVVIGGVLAPITVWNDTQITGRIPGALAAGEHAGVVERQTAEGLQRSGTFYFTVMTPEVYGITPSSGPIGIAYVLSGANFGAYSGSNTRVLLAGTTTPISVWNGGQVQGTVPGLRAGGKECVLEIATADGGLARSGTFYFEVVQPVVESFSPSSGTIGVPFVINGSGFGTYNGTNTRVLLGGVAAPVTVWNDTQIKGTIPGIAEDGDKSVVVERATSDGGLSQTAAVITYTLATPVVNEIIPESGPIGIPYTLNGYNFGPYNGTNTQVLVNGTTTAITVWNDTQIKGTIPGVPAGSQAVVVSRRSIDGGVRQSAAVYFTVSNMAVSAVTPSSGPIGIAFTIDGANFGSYNGTNTRVKIGVSTAPITVWNDTQIKGTIPGLASGEYALAIERVSSDGGLMRSATMPFLVTAPAVASMTPASGPIGIAYTLDGTSFGTYNGANTQVLIGGATTAITLWNDTKIQGTIPGTIAAGAHDVVVRRKTADGGAVLSSSMTFTVSELGITGVTPSSGPIGIAFTINGSNFGTYNGTNTRVKVGVSTAPITVWNDVQIKGTVPGVAAGEYAMTVERVTSDGGLMSVATGYLVVSPVVANVTPSTAPIGQLITINGSGFGTYNGTNTRVKINGVVMPVTSWIDTQIKGTVPGIAQAGSYDLVVERATSDGGLAQSAAITFGVVSPQVASISPVSSQVGTITYTLNGTGFGSYNGANTVVLIGGTTTAISVWNDVQIKGTTPGALGTGTHSVIVRRVAQGVYSDSNELGWTLTLPVISGITPQGGAAGEGFTLSGTGFGNYDGTLVGGYPSTRVLVGSVVASLSEWTDTQIRGIIPDGLNNATYGVTARRVTGAGSAISNAVSYTVINQSSGGSGSSAHGLRNFVAKQGKLGSSAYPSEQLEAGLLLPAEYGGRPESWNRTSIAVPAGVLGEDTYVTISLNKGEESTLEVLEAALAGSEVAAAGPTTVFGPLNTNLNGTVLIELPYTTASIPANKSELDLAICRWNKGRSTWESVPTTIDTANKRLQAVVSGFGTYQAMITHMPPADVAFQLGEIYSYPNPAKGGSKPVLHIEVGVADYVDVRIYDVAGDLRHSVRLDAAPSTIDDGTGSSYAYEYAWDASGVGSGVYVYVIEAHRGDQTIRATRKLTYIR